ncbi:prolactin-releasing peptide receptor-like isoform X2 [Mytilus galloprovincialis]|uniref:prolactin-releasing peptide receptor-like isoform X2 n=1 Tax=Mytilus galloprovincialis TaxID=29158 RepID=UPI003F7BD67C
MAVDVNLSRNSTNEVIISSSRVDNQPLIGLIILYSLTTFLSIVGNIIVVIVFRKGKRSRTDLRPFLINLAIADLLMALFCMPFTFADAIFRTWIFSEPFCPIVLFVQMLSVAASVFTNVAIGMDRFLVVAYPLKHRFTIQRYKYVIVAIWTCSILLASVQLFVARAMHFESGVLVCNEIWPNTNSRRIYTIFVLVLTYIIPLLILSITYSIVSFLLWKRTSPGNRDHFRDFLQWRSKIKVVKMLVIVVTIFGLCWLPLHVFTLVIDFHPEVLDYDTEADEKLLLGIYLGVHWLAMSNSFANPIIYSFTNDNFRADLFTLFYIWFPCCTCLKTMIRRTNSSSTKDSFIFRRQSTLRRSMGSFGGSRRQILFDHNRRNFGSFQNGTIREDSREKQEENERQLLQLEEILEKEITHGIQICCDQKSRNTETRIVRQSSCKDML